MSVQSNTTLEPNFHICELQGCRKISQEDTTGLYEEINNPGGYATTDSIDAGVQNPYVAEVLVALLDVIFPDGSTTQVDLKALYGSIFPNTNKQEITLTNANLGITGSFPTGWYTFTYTLTGTQIGGEDVQWSASTTKQLFFVCSVQCSIDQMFSKITEPTCESCSESALNAALTAQGFLQSAISASCCGKVNMADKLLSRASFEAGKSGCSSC